MNTWILTLILLASMILTIGVFAVKMSKKQRELLKKYPGYPRGYFQNQGMGVGIAIGAGIGVALQNIPVGVAIGIAIGVSMGARKEARHSDEIRPLTEEEKELRKQKTVAALVVLLVGLLVFSAIYFLAR